MKKPLLIITAIALMFLGCSDEESPFDDLILGVWVNTHVNDQPVLTDEAFICDFRADLTHLYSIGVTLDEENKSWIGTWYGRSTTAGASETYHYWDYLADGTFDYYFQDENENWINKPDNEGEYFLYGDLLASNYTNDLLSGETGKAYECWSISIADNKMTWHGLRENGLIVTFEMDKVDGPPM